jgi:hypothetical protein
MVGDFSYELPTYYCNLHNPDPISYPFDPTKTLNTNYFPGIDPTLPPIDPTLPPVDPNVEPDGI